MKRCPFCAQEIHEKALVCKHCSRDLNKSGSGFGKVFKFKFGYLVGILGLFLLWFAFLVYFPIFPRPDRSGETVTSPAKESTMHDLNLSKEVEDLWEEVETLYGMSIDLVFDELPAGLLGQAEVLPDGQPRLTIDNERGRSDQNIAHELFHLMLRKEGYGQYAYQFPGNVQGGDGLDAWGQWNNMTIREPLLHRLFYPKIREMGFEADEGLKVGTREAMEEGEYLGVIPETASRVHTGSFLRALIESNDQEFLSELEDWFIAQGWSESIAAARELRDFIEETDPHTPRDEMDTFVELLNRLYQHESLSFEISEWSTRTYGSQEEQFAEIRVRANRPK